MDGFNVEYKPGLASVPGGFRPYRFTCTTCQRVFWPAIQQDPDPAGERQHNQAEVPDPVPTDDAQLRLEAHQRTHDQKPGA